MLPCKPPLPVRNLLYALRVKLLARAAGIAAIETDGDLLVIRLPSGWTGDERRLEAQCAVRSFEVVVPDKLIEYRAQMLLVQDDQVVEALAAECPDHPFRDRVRTR